MNTLLIIMAKRFGVNSGLSGFKKGRTPRDKTRTKKPDASAYLASVGFTK